MHLFFKRALTALAAAGIMASTACAATGGMPDELNIVYVKAPFNLQNMVLKERGMLEKAFEKYGTRVKWHTITSGAKQAQAMAADSIDVSAVMNTASFLMGNGAGSTIYIADGVAHPTDTFAIVGPKGKTLSIKELRGKKVAGPRGTVLHQLLVAALKKEGMTINDVNFVQMGIPQSFAALMSGKVDAALIAAGALVKAEQAGKPIIATATGLVTPKLAMCAGKKFIDEKPELVKVVVAAQDEAYDWVMNNHKEAIALGAREQGISEADAERLYAWSHYNKRLNEDDIKSLDEDMTFLIENGMARKRVDSRSFILDSAMEQK